MTDNTNARHPDSTFSTDYPYNQATVTRSGHEFHINDAPGKESLRIAHTTGTYVEVESTGRWVQVVTERCYNYVMKSLSETVDQHVDYKIGGNKTLNIDGYSYENVRQNKEVGIGGNLIDGVGGVRDITTIKDKSEVVGENSIYKVRGDYDTNVVGNKVTVVDGVRQDTLNKDWSVTSKGAVDMQVCGDFRIQCDNFIVNAKNSVTITTAIGDVTVNSNGLVFIRGVEVHLNDILPPFNNPIVPC